MLWRYDGLFSNLITRTKTRKEKKKITYYKNKMKNQNQSETLWGQKFSLEKSFTDRPIREISTFSGGKPLLTTYFKIIRGKKTFAVHPN